MEAETEPIAAKETEAGTVAKAGPEVEMREREKKKANITGGWKPREPVAVKGRPHMQPRSQLAKEFPTAMWQSQELPSRTREEGRGVK